MADEAKVIDIAEKMVDSGLSLDGLDQVFENQRLIGLVMAQQALLETIATGPVDERRKAAYQFIRSVDEDPEHIADRIRESAFQDLSLEDLHAIVETGELDPERAREKLDAASS